MSVRALLVAFATLGAAFTAQAQSVTTAPVGAVSKTIPVGLTSVGISLLNPDLVVANCASNSPTVLTLSGVSNVASLLTASTPYYLEAVNGPLEGERFDVDTAATLASANSTVTITLGGNNTTALASGSAAGSQFALRKHITVSQVQSFFSTPLIGNNNAALADQIQILNSTGNGFVVYYLRGNGTEWRVGGSTTIATNFVIAPGVGIFVKKVSTPSAIVVTGGVRVNDFAMPLALGLGLHAPGYPVPYSPQAFGGTLSNGWTANNQAALADQLQVLNAEGTGFTSYYLRANGTEWRVSGATTVVTTTEVLPAGDAFMVLRRNSADANYGHGVPFTL